MKSIIQRPVPVIAKVNGFATAGDSQLVAICDIFVYAKTSEVISAKGAYSSGIVTKDVSADKLHDEVSKVIQQIQRKSRSIISLGNEFIYKQIDPKVVDVLLGEEVMIKNIKSDDGQDVIRSFIEKCNSVLES